MFLKKIFFFFFSQTGVISAFSKGQGVTKRGQGSAPCKRSLGRTLCMLAGASHCLSVPLILSNGDTEHDQIWQIWEWFEPRSEPGPIT